MTAKSTAQAGAHVFANGAEQTNHCALLLTLLGLAVGHAAAARQHTVYVQSIAREPEILDTWQSKSSSLRSIKLGGSSRPLFVLRRSS